MTNDHHIHEDCLKLFEKLSEYIDDELAPATYNKIKKHVGECLRCKVCVESLKKSVELCRHLEKEPIPDSLSKKLADLVRQIPVQE